MLKKNAEVISWTLTTAQRTLGAAYINIDGARERKQLSEYTALRDRTAPVPSLISSLESFLRVWSIYMFSATSKSTKQLSEAERIQTTWAHRPANTLSSIETINAKRRCSSMNEYATPPAQMKFDAGSTCAICGYCKMSVELEC